MPENKDQLDYSREIKLLSGNPPERIYILYGPEDYLKNLYFERLEHCVIPDGDDGFSCHRFSGTDVPFEHISDAVNSMPFLSERILIELKEFDVNKYKDAEKLLSLFSDIPDYCTVVIKLPPETSPDNRLKLTKLIKDKGRILNFTSQNSGALTRWIQKRFSAFGKKISEENAQRLAFISGDIMSGLIPEIEKVAAYSTDEVITAFDIDTAAHHIPEAVVFDLMDAISEKNSEKAAGILTELLSSKESEPIAILALLQTQLKRLYLASIAREKGYGEKFLIDTGAARFDSHARKLLYSAKGFKAEALKNSIARCADADFMMKSSSEEPEKILIDTVMIIAGTC